MLTDEANWPVCTEKVNGINCLDSIPLFFQANREHDNSQFRWIQSRTSQLSAETGSQATLQQTQTTLTKETTFQCSESPLFCCWDRTDCSVRYGSREKKVT